MSGSKDEVEDPIEFFKKANASAIARVLHRADQNAAKEARRQQNIIRSALRPRRTLLGKALRVALSHHGRASNGRPSIRQTAPDTGGRPYHFGFSSVTKGESARGGRGGGGKMKAGGGGSPAGEEGGTPGGGRTARKGRSAGASQAGATINGQPRSREAAHQNYAERYAALEKNPMAIQEAIREEEAERRLEQEGRAAGAERDGPSHEQETAERGPWATRSLTTVEIEGQERDGPGVSAGQERSRQEIDPALSQEWVEREIGRGPGLSDRHNEAAAQAYIENPDKSAQLHGTTASFGTIGETFEDRLEFWDLVHKHESKDGRTQSRLVVELPHEASAKARHGIVRRFTDDLLEKGIPFWASIHAPTKKNDYRNHHAHIVFIDRPASKMAHPETGKQVWDFTVAVKIKKASRNTILSFPYRQNRDPDMRDRGYIKRSRARFSEITNEVMEKHNVGVRYDPRSYKDMGLDVAPMVHVNRILADKTKSQSFVVMDPEWTRKMINQEMKAAAIRRDETYQALRATEDKLQSITRAMTNTATAGKQNTASANKVLPKDMQLTPGHALTKAIGNKLVKKWTEAERDRLAAKLVDEVTIRTLNHIIEATTVKTTSKGPAKIHSSGQAPDAEDLRHINDAAREELAAFRIEAASRSRSFGFRLASVSQEWRDESTGTTGRKTAWSATPQPDATQTRSAGRPSEATPKPNTSPASPSRAHASAQSAPPHTKATAPVQASHNVTKSQVTLDSLTQAALMRHQAARKQGPSPGLGATRRTSERTNHAAIDAAEIERNLQLARQRVTRQTQRMITMAGSPDKVATMVAASMGANSAAAQYAAYMARMREQAQAAAQVPLVRIVSSETVGATIDPAAEAMRRRQAAQAAPVVAGRPAVEKPVSLAVQTSHPSTVPQHEGTAAAAASTPAAIAKPATGERTATTATPSAAAATNTATKPSTVTPGNQTAPTMPNRRGDKQRSTVTDHGQTLPLTAERRIARGAAAGPAAKADGPAPEAGQTAASRAAKRTAATGTPPVLAPLPARAEKKPGTVKQIPVAQPELFTTAAAPAPSKTGQELAKEAQPKPPAPLTPEELEADAKRKKRRWALLAERQRNRDEFEL